VPIYKGNMGILSVLGLEKTKPNKANPPDESSFKQNRNGINGIALDCTRGLRLELSV